MRLLSQGIKSKERVNKYGEVFTPAWLVSDMCDLCEPDISDPAKTILEPACGNGNFLVEILKRRLEKCEGATTKILAAIGNIYAVDIQEDNVRESRSRMLTMLPLYLWKEARPIFERNIVIGDFLKPETVWFLKEQAGAQGWLI